MSDTPYFLLDVDRLERQYRAIEEAFAGAKVHYAVKANSHPDVLSALSDFGCGFEAASWPEIERLLGLGVEPERIIYGTAVKPQQHVEQAWKADIDQFAADSAAELAMLAEAAPGAQIFVRGLVDNSRSVFQMSRKFGAPLGTVAPLLVQAASLGLQACGLSFNVGSQSLDADAWAAAVRSLRPVFVELERSGIELASLNIGGGFPLAYRNHPTVPSLENIAELVIAALDELPYRPQLLLEPGRALVGPAISLVTSVVSRVERDSGPWLFLDAGVYNALFEAMDQQGSTRYPVRPEGDWSEASTEEVVLTGPTGDAIDVIDPAVQLPIGLEVGDRLRFDHAGAYTLSMACAFNGFEVPPIRTTELPTVSSRKAIGFPDEPTEWNASPAVYDVHSLRIHGHPVMEDWEAGYMGRLAEIACSQGGTVLEVGYGMGLSARAIQEQEIDQHFIVECHPDVAGRCLLDLRDGVVANRVHLLTGFWENLTPLLRSGSFDGILFDTYPLKEDEIHANHFWFFKEAYRLLKSDGVLTYYSDEATDLSVVHRRTLAEAGFRPDLISFETCAVEPPADCEYWRDRTIVAPMVRKQSLLNAQDNA
jgi:ornithine decarboxylase